MSYNTSTGAVSAQRYTPYGAPRGPASTLPTDYRFTGQRSEEAGLGSLYDYNARHYSPALGRFLSPDSIVPSPGNPQSLNRYSYVRNNPLRFIDPSGMAECAAGDQQCWVNEWNFKNNWYNARGYFWSGNHWGDSGEPIFANEQVTNEVIGDAGISLAGGGWSWANKQKVAYGAAKFGQKLSGGIAALKALLGGYAVINLVPKAPFYCQGACVPYWPLANEHTVYMPVADFTGADLVGGAQWMVHELAHVIDWVGGFSSRWPFDDLTNYSRAAPNVPIFYRRSWERWAEAVTIWVFGNEDGQGGYVTSYKTAEVQQYLSVDTGKQLMDRMRIVQSFLEGW